MAAWVRAVLGQPVGFRQIWELALEPVCKLAQQLGHELHFWEEAQPGGLQQLLDLAASVP